jgi:hypothetical protein
METFESQGRSKLVIFIKKNCFDKIMYYRMSDAYSTQGRNKNCIENYGRNT